MKIGIVGAGMIGSTFASLFSNTDHEVMISSKNQTSSERVARENKIEYGKTNELIQWADVILLAVPFIAVTQILRNQSTEATGKIIIDVTNPFINRDGEIAQRIIEDPELTSSEFVQNLASGFAVIKAFNATHYKDFLTRAFTENVERLAVPVAGNSTVAKTTVLGLINSLGMAGVDFGDLSQGQFFEPGTSLFNENLSIRDAMIKWGSYIE